MAKLNYLAMDRPDIRHAASIMESHASGRRWRLRSDRIMAYTDSDWEANREDRRSVSGGMLVHSGRLLRFWSRRQKAVSLSSWESELYAAVSLSRSSRTSKWAQRHREQHACDNCMRQPRGAGPHTACQGLELAKHVHSRHLRLHAARDEGWLDVVKIRMQRNPVDLLTKLLPLNRIPELCKLVGVEYDQDSKTLEVLWPSTRCPRT